MLKDHRFLFGKRPSIKEDGVVVGEASPRRTKFIGCILYPLGMAKIQPAVTQLYYAVGDGASYIDLAKDLSAANRRLYRQGMTYVIQDIQLAVSPGMRATDVFQVSFSTMGNSWMVHNAWTKAFRTWQRMQNEYMDGAGARLKGKWADFKIYLDDSQAGGTTHQSYASDGAVYAAGEWVYSNFVYDDAGAARSPSMHMIGSVTSDSAIGLIEAYANSRNYQGTEPNNPAEIATGFYAEYHGVGDIDDELGADLRDDNDLPPYELDDYPGGDSNADAPVFTRFGSVNATQSTAQLGGFIVPCGLLKISTNELQLTNTTESATDLGDVAGTGVASPGPLSVYEVTSATTVGILITLAPGPYRGVLAAPMGQ